MAVKSSFYIIYRTKENLFIGSFTDLVKCKYYITSETQYGDFIKYIENENETKDEHFMKIRFFTLAKTAIKVSLTANNDSNLEFPDYPVIQDPPPPRYSENYRKRRDYEIDETTQIPTTTLPPTIYAAQSNNEIHTNTIGYEIGNDSTMNKK